MRKHALEVVDNKIFFTVLGSFLGLLSAILVQLITYSINKKKDRAQKNLEIMGILSAFRAEVRVYQRQLDSNLSVFSKYEAKPNLIGKVLSQTNFAQSKVYDAYTNSIGSLGPVYSEQIVRFYASVDALRQTISLLREYISNGDDTSEIVVSKVQSQLVTASKRAAIIEAIISASLVKGPLSEKIQLEQIQALNKEP
ncbi:hypothetical protein [Grimontia indica]|uniref:hypothetical protein n=1 Tax=Grimontia indica TaxID=1056512 RepID=UPI000586C115|nr:hypothetical protein [Grimontia indica]